MSLAFLKQAFFGAPAPIASADERRHLLPGGSLSPSSSTSTEFDADVEALNPKGAVAAADASGKGRVDPRIVSDATIGLADGLTVPFALTAGLSALGDTRVVIYGGFAELIAGALSMGLGGYLGAKSEIASYVESRSETESQIQDDPAAVRSNIRTVFEPYDLPGPAVDTLVDHLSASHSLPDFLMKFYHCELEPPTNRAFTSAFTIALGYFLGGFVPLVPYFFLDDVMSGLRVSVAVMAVALFAFGYGKTCVVSGWRGSRRVWDGVIGGVQMVIVGGVAAGAAMGLVMAFSQLSGSNGEGLSGGLTVGEGES